MLAAAFHRLRALSAHSTCATRFRDESLTQGSPLALRDALPPSSRSIASMGSHSFLTTEPPPSGMAAASPLSSRTYRAPTSLVTFLRLLVADNRQRLSVSPTIPAC
jgi:hypothetical protein